MANIPFQYAFKNPAINSVDLDETFSFRKPAGIEYNTSPVVVFGDSYVFGLGLEKEQTFTYKLAYILKRPVYNRGVCGQSLQQMYYQSENPVFYEQVPKADTMIYIIIQDSYRRIYDYYYDITENNFLLHYDIKNGKLVYESYSNPFLNFLKSLYFVRNIRAHYIADYVYDENNAEKITDDVTLYCVKTRENLEKHWNNKIKFYFIIYDDVWFQDLLTKKLEQNNIHVLNLNLLISESLLDDKYTLSKDDGHPNEAAWDLVTPIVAEQMKKYEENTKE